MNIDMLQTMKAACNLVCKAHRILMKLSYELKT